MRHRVVWLVDANFRKRARALFLQDGESKHAGQIGLQRERLQITKWQQAA